jgi:hypothetical protein
MVPAGTNSSAPITAASTTSANQALRARRVTPYFYPSLAKIGFSRAALW